MSLRLYADIAMSDQADARGREHEALSEVVRRLEAAMRDPDDKAALSSALDFHDALWRFFMSDLADPGNALPDEVKAGLISIGIWATQKSLMARMTGGDLRALAETNAIVRDGLK